MRSKGEILGDLMSHAEQLDPQHYELAAVAIIETEVQLDIRDLLDTRLSTLFNLLLDWKDQERAARKH